jgi:hypothetical protein
MVPMRRMEGGLPPKKLDNFPKDWVDPLELYGNLLQELIAPGHDLGVDRKNVKALIERYGDRWVWDNRRRIVQMSRVDPAGEVG